MSRRVDTGRGRDGILGGILDRLLAGIDALCRVAAWGAAAVLAALFLLGLAEILLRNLFGYSLPIAVEYSGHLVGISLLLGSGWTLQQGGQIRVGLLVERLGPAGRRAVDTAATVFALVTALFLAAALVRYTGGTALRGTVSYFPSQTPLVIPQALLAAGPVTLALALLARLVRLLRGDGPDGTGTPSRPDSTAAEDGS